MKKFFLFLTLLTLSVGQMWGAETEVYTLNYYKTGSGTASSYTGSADFTSSSITWNVPGNQTTTPPRIGGAKNTTGTNIIRSIYSKTAISSNVCKVTITHGAKSGITVNSVTLRVYSTAAKASTGGNADISNVSVAYVDDGTMTFNRPSGHNWTGRFYRIDYDLSWSSSSSAKYVQFTNAKFYKNTYTMAYNANGGSGTMTDSSSPYDEGATVTVKSNTFTAPANKEFDEWKTGASSGTSYAAGATFNITANTTLYAQWKDAAVACTNEITITKGTPSNGSFDITGDGNICIDGGNASVTISNINPTSGYRFKEITSSGGGTIDNSAKTVTNISANTTINVVFEQIPSHKAYFYNGSTLLNTGGTSFQEGASVTYGGSSPISCDSGEGASNTFVGWATAEWDGKVAKNAIVPDFYEGTLPVMGNEDVTYYAVFAKVSSASELFSWEGGGKEALTDLVGETVYGLGSDYASGNSPYLVKLDNTGDYIVIATSAAIGSVAVGVKMIGGASTSTLTIQESTAANGTFTDVQALSISGSQNDVLNLSTSNAFKSESRAVKLLFTKGSNVGVGPITITGVASASNYMTTCCIELGSINGSVSMSQNSATLEWADLDHVSSWAVQYKEHSAENWNTWNGAQATADSKRSVTINSLSCGTAYDFKIAATATSGYCDAEQVIENQSTTKWEISYDLDGTVNLSEGPAEGANACGEITATFSKNALYSFPENITVKIGGEDATADTDYLWDYSEGTLVISAAAVTGDVVIMIAGVAPLNPIVTPNPTALSFTQVKKGADVPAAQDITLEGHNLTEDLTVVSSNTSLYVVSVKSGSLTPDNNKDASPVITVTPQEGITSTAGDKDATITISGGGLAADVVVNVTFNVQETYTVNWYVNGTKIDANSKTDVTGTAVSAPSDFSSFTDCVPDFHFIGWKEGSAITGGSSDTKPTLVTPISAIGTANVDYYAVFADGTPASTTKLLDEDFDNELSNDNSNAYGTTNGGNKPAGFTGTLDKAYAGKNGTAKLGTSSAAGYITSKSLDLSEAFSVSIKVKRYNDTDGGNVEITIDGDNDTKQVISNDDINSSTFESFKLNFDAATSTSTIKIATSDKRAYIDDVVVSQAVAENFSMYYTTCPHVSRVTLSAASVENGSISFEQSGSAVTNVRTDGGEDVEVDVVPDPATGYELTGIALSGTAASHASYDAGVITIDPGTEGALTVTATFEETDYIVTLNHTEGVEPTMTGATNEAHYDATINLTTTVPDNALFVNWTSSDVTITNPTSATEASFTMPAKNVTVTANFTVVHNVAWANDNTPSSGKSEFVYVKGIVTDITEISTEHGNATYYISDLDENGEAANSYLVFRAKKEGNTDYTSNTQLKEGDEVIVYGKLTNYQGTKEFDQGGYIITNGRTVATFDVVVSGTATKTDYFAGETFAYAGLTAKAEYSTGYKKTVTPTWKANNVASYTVNAAGMVNVTATWNETTSEDFPVVVTVTTKTLESIELSETELTGYKGQALPKPTTVTAHFDDNGVKSTSDVTAFATIDGSSYDASSTEEQTFTVSYQFGITPAKTADYTVTLIPVRNTLGTAYTVAKGREIIDIDNTDGNDLELDESANKVFVLGRVTAVSGNTYTIKDNAENAAFIEIYEGTLGTGISSVMVGDLIKVEGNLFFYENNTHTVQKYRITNGEIVAVVRTPNLTVADVAEMEINITADLGVDDLTINKDGSNGAITFSCSDAAVTIVNNKLHAAAAGDATVTATIAADGIYTAAETTFNVHVIAERTRYAITMDKNGGSGTDPVYDNQLAGATIDLPADNTYSKANSAFDAWVVTETVSGDAVAVTDGHFTMPAAAVTIKATWNEVETCHISFRVSGSEVATADAPQTVAYTLSQTADDENGYEFVGWAESEENTDVETVLTTISSYTPALNEDSKILYAVFRKSVEGGEVTDEITNADLAATGSGYVAFTNVTISTGAVYAGTTSKSNGIQMNADSPKGMVTTTTGGLLKNISIEWNSECTANRVLDVYAKNTAYTGSSDLWGAAAAQGTKVTSFTNDGSITSYDFEADYAYIGVRSNDKALNINKISITWETAITYYTTNPVAKYNIKYRAGDAENVTGLCDAERTWGTITLCAAPTCADKDFAKWSDGTNLYAAGASYTLSADVTFTATWTDKPKYTVTYTANGGTGTAPAVEEYLEGATVTVKENEYFSKPGFVYAGWQVVYNDGVNNHEITPDEDSKFEMVAYNVTIKALWEEPSNQKWVRVGSTDELATDGTNYIIVASQANAAMGALNGAVYNSIGIVKTGNYLNGPESMTKVTLEDGSEDGKYAMKHGTKYLYSTTAKNIGERDDSFDWTITIANGVATINAGTAGKLQFNTGNPRFTTYTSSQQAVAIYREKALTPINQDDMTEADVNTYDDVEIAQNKTWTVENDKEVGDVYMKEGAVIANSATVTANDLYFKAKAGKSNQIFDLSKITVVSNMYYDFQLCDGDLDADYWYSISVPFDVDLNDGVFQVGGTTPLVNHTDFEVWEYDPQKRADTQSNGWKRSSDNMMHAGKAYLIGFNPGQPNIIRLKAAAGWKTNLFSGTSMSVVSTGGSGTHDNWNGLANPTGRYIDVDKDAQVFNNNTHGWDSYDPAALSFNFVVGTAFFVQSDEAVTISNTDHNGQYRAPKRVDETKCAYAVRITRDEAESFDNQIIVRASEDATSEYEQGHDMLTMNDATSKKAALLWTKNYGGKRLAIEEAPFVGDKASYELGIYAPANGTYFISVAEAKDNADLYLTYEGCIIWNLSVGAYEVELGKGATNEYGLMLVRKAPQVTTGMENVQGDKTQCTKVILNDHVYILRDAQLYDVTGKAVK